MKELTQEFPIDLHWRSYELRPDGSPPIPPAYLARIEQSRGVLADRLMRDHNVTLNSGPFGISSRPALILEKYAEAQGKGGAYREVVDRAYWTQAQDISRLDVLGHLLSSVGLDVPDLDVIFSNPQWENSVNSDIMYAYQAGIQGVPALVFAERFLVSGAQPTDVLRRVVRQVAGIAEDDLPAS